MKTTYCIKGSTGSKQTPTVLGHICCLMMKEFSESLGTMPMETMKLGKQEVCENYQWGAVPGCVTTILGTTYHFRNMEATGFHVNLFEKKPPS